VPAVSTLAFYDAAYPPKPPPAGMDGVIGYLPGGDEMNAWSNADWESQPARYRLPVFVRANPPGPGAAADAAAALAGLRAIGAPLHTLVAWDMETAADPAYVIQVSTLIARAGYELILYGSQSTVFGNRVPDGLYFGADWTNAEHLALGDVMTQWESFTRYDVDAAQKTLPFWDTQPGPAPLLPVNLYYLEDSMLLLPPPAGPTSLRVPSGATKIGFAVPFGETGGFPSASLSVNFHGVKTPVAVTVDPDQPFPTLDIPAGCGSVCVYWSGKARSVGYEFDPAS
jgi:hypothetical protein